MQRYVQWNISRKPFELPPKGPKDPKSQKELKKYRKTVQQPVMDMYSEEQWKELKEANNTVFRVLGGDDDDVQKSLKKAPLFELVCREDVLPLKKYFQVSDQDGKGLVQPPWYYSED